VAEQGVMGKDPQVAIWSHDDSDIPSMNAFVYTGSLLNGCYRGVLINMVFAPNM
jgi:hypothetical protein